MVLSKENILIELFWIIIYFKCKTVVCQNETKIIVQNSTFHLFENFNQTIINADDLNASLSKIGLLINNKTPEFDALKNLSFNDLPKNNINSIWRLEYTLIIAICAGVIVTILITSLLCWKRHSRTVHPPQRSVYSVQDGTWDSLSLHYIDNPAEFTKESWDEMSDDSYVASLDQAMARRVAPVTYYRNHAVLGNGPAAFRHSTSSTVPIVAPNPDPL